MVAVDPVYSQGFVAVAGIVVVVGTVVVAGIVVVPVFQVEVDIFVVLVVAATVVLELWQEPLLVAVDIVVVA